MGDALLDLLATNPDRIIVETSGSAYPAPIAWEVRRLEEEGHAVKLDSIICVVDVENFPGYEDKSYTAKIQAKYTDLILLNKTEVVSEQQIDRVLDDVFEVNPDTPKIRTKKGFVDAELLIGMDSTLFQRSQEAVCTSDSCSTRHPHAHADHTHGKADEQHHAKEVDLLHWSSPRSEPGLDFNSIVNLLEGVNREKYYRIKGVLYINGKTVPDTHDSLSVPSSLSPLSTQAKQCFPVMVNYAFGRYEMRVLQNDAGDASFLTFMGQGIKRKKEKGRLASLLGVSVDDLLV